MNSILLSRFLEALRTIAPLSPPYVPLPVQHRQVDERALTALFAGLRTPLYGLRAAGGSCNPWRVARLGRNEVRNTAVLAWLIDPAGDHGLGSRLLDALLSRINSLQMQIPAAVGSSVSVIREAYLRGEGINRIDIELRCHDVARPFYLLVEAKIDAPEGLEQIPRYIAAAQAGAGSLPWAIVYLTTDGRAARALSAFDYSQVLALSWEELARRLLAALHRIEPSHPSYQGFSYRLAETFLRHVREL